MPEAVASHPRAVPVAVLSTLDDIEVLRSDFENRLALKTLQLDRLGNRPLPPGA